MIKLRSLPLHVTLCIHLCIPMCVLPGAFLFPALSQGQGVAPAVRIVSRIDESQLVTLRGNTHPFANARHDQGKVADSLPMTDLILVLSRDPAQQAAFDAYVAGEYDQNSPNYHQWLTPDQIGEQFGPSQTDILTITNWLTGHGFTVSQVTRDRMSIRFGGTAAQVESAFHTEIHNLTVKGEAHIGNMSDPQIPTSLATVVIGVKALHNFFPKPAHHMGQTVQRAQTGGWLRPAASKGGTAASSLQSLPNATANSRKALPQFGISVGGTNPYLVEDVSPWDFATIYNVTPLWNAGIDGTGQTIAIAGTSAICLGQVATPCEGSGGSYYNDVATFRSFFNLPTTNSWNTPIEISGNGSPPTVCTNTSQYCSLGDLEENSLDVEWSASIAKNAQIVLVSSYPASATDDGLYDSESYIVDNLTARIMNVSYGECELGLGTAGNVQYYDLWQTAAAEGIAVFVAAGDSGSASCDDGYDQKYGAPWSAQYGTNVSGLASTPYNTAIGGTDFNWCSLTSSTECTPNPYWNSSNNASNQSTAIGYVPEIPWNDTCTNPTALGFIQLLAKDYGTSSVTDAETACNFSANYNVRAYIYSNYRFDPGELVDTVGGSGGASNCVLNTTNPNLTTLGTCTTGQTSTGTSTNPDTNLSQGSLTITTTDGWPKPSWQTGVTGIPNDGVRDLPDVSFFASDGFLSSSAYLICVSPAASYYFNDQPCSYSTNAEPFAEEVGGTSVATPAMAGVMALINQKAGAVQGSPNAGLYALAAKQTYSSCSAERGNGQPITSSSCWFNDIDTGTNAMACDYGALDGGSGSGGQSVVTGVISPNCTVLHSGDQIGILNGYNATAGFDLATGLGSLNVANVVNAWQSTTGTAAAKVTVTPSVSTLNTDNWLAVTVTVASASGGALTPTGEITLVASAGSGPALTTLAGTLNSSGSYTFEVPPNTLSAGTDRLTASYGGDSTYGIASNSAQVSVSNAPLTTSTVTVKPAASSTDSNASLGVTVTVTPASPSPTGTVYLTGGGYSSSVPWPALSGGSYTFTIPANTLSGTVGGQSDTLTATYSGDSNYAAATGQGSVTVLESTFKLTPGAPSSSSVTPGQSATVTVTAAPTAGYTGILTLTCAQTSTTAASGGDGTACTGSGNSQINLATCGASCSVTFTIGTSPPVAAALDRPKLPGGNKGPGGRELLGAGSGAVLALLVFFGIPARRRSWRSMLSILVALVAIGALASCSSGGGSGGGGGGGGQGDPGTLAGTYTYTVTVSATPSVTPPVTQTFTVTVN
jgi:hypothetical protein